MKRIFSFFMALCLLLTLFPLVMPIAAEDTAVPKDESGASPAGMETASVTLSVYDALYVGADGSNTANGGSLIGLYSAFTKGDASVTLSSGTTNGLWKNKMDLSGATDATLRDSYTAKNWEWGSEKGIAYHMTESEWLTGCLKMGLTLPEAWASKPAFTVETSFVADGIAQTGSSKLAIKYSAIRLDHLTALWLPATSGEKHNIGELYCFRWDKGISPTWSNTFYSGTNSGTDLTLFKMYKANFNTPLATTMRFCKNVITGDTDETSYVNFGVQYMNGVTYASSGYTVAAYSAATGTNDMPVFSLFNGIPGEMYAVRVYDAPLTEAEFAHNACIDLLAYVEADLDGYLSLSAAQRGAVDAYMVGNGFADGKNAIKDRYMEIVSAYMSGEVTEDSTYYVTDGLVLLLSSYKGFESGFFNETSSKGTWFNAMNREQTATLKGKGWYKNAENGGLTIERTYEEYKEDKTFGVYLPVEVMPEEDYTLEVVANPVGITTFDETGERVRYIDTITRTGTYNTMGGFAVGALRCLQFACYRPGGKDGQLERRWYYSHNKELSALNWQFLVQDVTWQDLAYDEVVSFGITHDYTVSDETATSSYALLNNGNRLGVIGVGSDEYKTFEEAGQKLFVMVGVAGTVFSVRMYDRVLTEAEMSRNHAADVIYFYDLDTSLLDVYLQAGFDRDTLFSAIAELDFSMTAEEAQKAFDTALLSTWLYYDGMGLRRAPVDGKEGVRYYFTVNEEAIHQMTALGFTVEFGALANVDKATEPLLSDCDYKITAWNGGVKNSGFYTDTDTFALTVFASDTQKGTMLTSLLVKGYLRLVDASGEETVLYLPVGDEEFLPQNLFDVYAEMQTRDAVSAVPALLERVGLAVRNSYDNIIVHLQAGAPAGGDGTLAAPYHSFADAFAACKAIMAKTNRPTKLTLLLGDGEYGVYGTATLSAEEMPYRHLHFTVASETGNAALTTTKSIEATGFVNEGNGVWSYQFEKDENGEYPAFRYLYVNGKMQDYSYIATRHAREDNTYQSPYDRKFDAVHAAVKALYDAGTLTLASAAPYDVSRTDLHAAFHDYKIRFLALMDEKALYAAGTLTIDTAPAAMPEGMTEAETALYTEAFEEHKLTDLVIDDLQAQYMALPSADRTLETFATFKPTQYTDNKAYTDRFDGLRTEIGEDRKISSLSSYRAAVKTTAEENAKVYLPLALLAGFEDQIAAMDPTNNGAISARAAVLVAEAQEAVTAAQTVKTAADALLTEKTALAQAAYNAYQVATYEERAEKLLAYNMANGEKERAAATASAAETALTQAQTALTEAETRAASMTDENTWIRYALEGSGLEIHWSGQWWFNILDIAGIDYDDLDASGKNVACYLDPDEYKMYFVHGGYTMENRNICIKGAAKFVDSENEFYYDEQAGKVYTYQPDGVSGKTFSYPTSDRMFILTEVKNVTFDSVTFTGVDDYYMSTHACCLSLSGVESKNDGYISDRSAVRLYSCFGLDLINCQFRELGCKGLHGTDKLENITVDSCTFERLGANAIYLGEGAKESVRIDSSHYVEDIRITNNYVHQIGMEYHSATAIWINLAKDVKIVGNTVDDCAYTAISVGYTFGDPSWRAGESYHIYNTEIAYNYITNFMTEIGDGGAIYVTGGNSNMEDDRLFNYMHDNYVVMSNLSGDGLGHMICGIYFDGSSSNWYCYDNVVVEQSYGSVEGENDDLYGAGDKYVKQLRNRRTGSTYIYLQHIEGQETHNILCEGNYILNVRAIALSSQKTEVYKNYVKAERNLAEKDTHYVVGLSYIPAAAQSIAVRAGAVGYKGDTALLLDNNY